MYMTFMQFLKGHWVGLTGSALVILALQSDVLGALFAALLIVVIWIFSIMRGQQPSPQDAVQVAAGQLVGLTQELNIAVAEVVSLASGELQQLDSLVSTAIADLDLSFSAIGKQSADQQQMVQQLVGQRDSSESDTDRFTSVPSTPLDAFSTSPHVIQALAQSNAVIHDQVGLAIRALQFEDMAKQIIEHLHKRVADIGDFTGQLADQASGLGDAVSAQECSDRLTRLRHYISANRQRLKQADHQAVTQSSMDEGDIELF